MTLFEFLKQGVAYRQKVDGPRWKEKQAARKPAAGPILPRDWKLTLPKQGEEWAEKEQFDELSRRSLSEHLTTVRCRGPLREGEVAVICVLRNEAARLPLFFEHYKKIGVDRFFMVDNDSYDGSHDILLAERRADVFHTKVPYSQSCSGIYWYNGLAQAYCRGNWVLAADADELLVYDGMDRHDLGELGQWLGVHGFDRLFAIMLDVYPSGSIGRGERTIAQILKQDSWFDDTGYLASRRPSGWVVYGGPRYRLFETNSGAIPAPISKYPFFRMGEQTSYCNAHFLWPFDTTTNIAFGTFIHLKLMDDLAKRSAVNVEEDQHWGNAFHYRKLHEQLNSDDTRFVAVNPQSRRYSGPGCLIQHKIMSPIRWDHKAGTDPDSLPERSRSGLAVGKIGWMSWRKPMPPAGRKWKMQEAFNLLSNRSLNEHLKVVRCRGPLRDGELGLICVLRNEAARLPLFIEHYKKLGVTRFFMIDNNSEDGSLDLLLAEPSADIFHTQVLFNEGQGGLYWANGIAREYCTGHWVVRADADELLVYDGMESHDLRELAEWLHGHGMDRLFAPELDVYPSKELGANEGGISEFLERDCWFDATGYNLRKSEGGWFFCGGVRKRLFGQQRVRTWPLLSKYPFFHMSEDVTIFHHHWLWPYDEVTKGPQGALIHLKIMDDLAERAARYARERQHFMSSDDYKVISDRLNSEPNIVAFHDRSSRYHGPESLIRHGFMLPINWDEPVESQEIEKKQSHIKPVAKSSQMEWISSLPEEGDLWRRREQFNWSSHSALMDQLNFVRCRGPLASNDIGAICVLRNNARHLPLFFEHYKKLGVTRFFMIDNNSDDGSRDIIMDESRADLLTTNASYAERSAGIGWVNGVARELCLRCWTVRANADELFVYDRMEQKDLTQLGEWLDSRMQDRITAPSIHVYPSGEIGRNERSISELLVSDCWFDNDGYWQEQRKGTWLTCGGAPYRLFGRESKAHPHWLSKHPFFRVSPDMSIVGDHFLWPVDDRKPASVGALLNLELMDSQDLGRRLTVRFSGSKRYQSPQSLIRYGVMTSIDW